MKRQRKTGVTSVPNVLSSAVNGRRGGEGETGKVSFGEMTLHRDLCDNITRVEVSGCASWSEDYMSCSLSLTI